MPNRSSYLPNPSFLAAAIRAGDRRALARGITLLESTTPEHEELSAQLLQTVLKDSNTAQRVGVTGAPGVGKSTFLDALGVDLIARGHRVAVLAVDPSSRISGGSILGDKTRMERLGREANAFIRPSPGGTTLGGIARRTRESLLLCEAAGFDVVLVETIGVGQGEAAVADMVDTLVLLLHPGAGDDLQGIKRGITESADVLVISKADDALRAAAERTKADYAAGLALLPSAKGWQVPVLSCSSLTGVGIEAVWQAVQRHRTALGESGRLDRRRLQAVRWFEQTVEERLLRTFHQNPSVRDAFPRLRAEVAALTLHPTAAARELLRCGGAI